MPTTTTDPAPLRDHRIARRHQVLADMAANLARCIRANRTVLAEHIAQAYSVDVSAVRRHAAACGLSAALDDGAQLTVRNYPQLNATPTTGTGAAQIPVPYGTLPTTAGNPRGQS